MFATLGYTANVAYMTIVTPPPPRIVFAGPVVEAGSDLRDLIYRGNQLGYLKIKCSLATLLVKANACIVLYFKLTNGKVICITMQYMVRSGSTIACTQRVDFSIVGIFQCT